MSESNRVWVHLYGGEQDGYRKKIELKTTAPKKFYIWHVFDGEKIKEASGKDKMFLRRKLATMAYELFDTAKIMDGNQNVMEYRYRRLESADRAVADPAL